MKFTKMELVLILTLFLIPTQSMAASEFRKPLDPVSFDEEPSFITAPSFNLEIRLLDLRRVVQSDSRVKGRKDGDSAVLESRTANFGAKKTHVVVISSRDGVSRTFELETFQLALRADLRTRSNYQIFKDCVDKAMEALSDWDRILAVRMTGIRPDQIFVQPYQLVENYLKQVMQKNMNVRIDRTMAMWQSKTVPELASPKPQRNDWQKRFETFDEIAKQIVLKNSMVPDISKAKIECELISR